MTQLPPQHSYTNYGDALSTATGAAGANAFLNRGLGNVYGAGLISSSYQTDHQHLTAYDGILTGAQRKQKLQELVNALKVKYRYQQTTGATVDDVYKLIEVDLASPNSVDFLQDIVNTSSKIAIEGLPEENRDIRKLSRQELSQLIFYYRPTYPFHKTKDQLVELLKNQPAGIDTDSLLDSYIGAEQDLKALRREGIVMQIPSGSLNELLDEEDAAVDGAANGSPNKDKSSSLAGDSKADVIRASGKQTAGGKSTQSRIYYRHDYEIHVSDDIRALWHNSKLPTDSVELETRLSEAGHMSVEDMKQGFLERLRRQRKKVERREQLEQADAKRRRKEERDAKKSQFIFRRGQHLTNVHLIDKLGWLGQSVNK